MKNLRNSAARKQQAPRNHHEFEATPVVEAGRKTLSTPLERVLNAEPRLRFVADIARTRIRFGVPEISFYAVPPIASSHAASELVVRMSRAKFVAFFESIVEISDDIRRHVVAGGVECKAEVFQHALDRITYSSTHYTVDADSGVVATSDAKASILFSSVSPHSMVLADKQRATSVRVEVCASVEITSGAFIHLLESSHVVLSELSKASET